MAIPKELIAVIREGGEFEAMVRQPAWTKLLMSIEEEINIKLAAMRACRSHSQRTKADMMDEWRTVENAYQRFQELALIPIARKKEAEEEVRIMMGAGAMGAGEARSAGPGARAGAYTDDAEEDWDGAAVDEDTAAEVGRLTTDVE